MQKAATTVVTLVTVNIVFVISPNVHYFYYAVSLELEKTLSKPDENNAAYFIVFNTRC